MGVEHTIATWLLRQRATFGHSSILPGSRRSNRLVQKIHTQSAMD
jgi:hypothetical protein